MPLDAPQSALRRASGRLLPFAGLFNFGDRAFGCLLEPLIIGLGSLAEFPENRFGFHSENRQRAGSVQSHPIVIVLEPCGNRFEAVIVKRIEAGQLAAAPAAHYLLKNLQRTLHLAPAD